MLKNKRKIILLILMIGIILAGVIIILTKGLNVSLQYQESISFNINLKTEFENSEIKEIAKEVFGTKKILVQKVGVMEEIVRITVTNPTDEEINLLVEKINVNYSLENTIEDVKKIEIPQLRLRDVLKMYFVPSILIATIGLIYILVTNLGKKEIFKKSIIYLAGIVVTETIYVSLLAITRLEVSEVMFTIGFVLLIGYSIIIMYKYGYNEIKKRKKK